MISTRMTTKRRFTILARHFTAAEECAFSGKALEAKQERSAVVIGGMVLDIQATPSFQGTKAGTTVPGEVRYVRGGVGRNVAECLARLDAAPFLISIVGEDMAGEGLLAHWQSLGLSVDGIRRCAGASTPVVSAVFDGTGELGAAVADTKAVEIHLTPDWIRRFSPQIQNASIVLLDANLHPSALQAACELANDVGVPVWFEPVSVPKAVRASGLLQYITFASPDEAELMAMAESLHPKNTKKESFVQQSAMSESNGAKNGRDFLGRELRSAIGEVLRAGLKHLVLTLGSEGAVLCSREPCGRTVYHLYPALPASVVNLSGAGDSLVAGTLAALSRKLTEVEAVAYGIAAAKFAVESDMNVPQSLSWAAVTDSAKSVFARAKPVEVLS